MIVCSGDYNFLDSYQPENDSGTQNSVLDIQIHYSEKSRFCSAMFYQTATDEKARELENTFHLIFKNV